LVTNKIALCGCHEYGFELIDYLMDNKINISYIISLTPEQAVENNVSGYISYDEIAKKYEIPIYYPKKYSLDDDDDLRFFQKHKFDLLILGGWQRLIPDKILKTFKICSLGFHGSSNFLPRGRGRSPVNWSIIEDQKRFILHLFSLKPEVDNGDIVDYHIFEINDWDTCKTVYYEISIAAKKMLLKNIYNILENNFKLIKQIGTPTYYPKRSPDDGEINWNSSSSKIYNLIRSITHPYPGSFTIYNNLKITIWSAQPFDIFLDYHEFCSGTVVEKFFNGDFVVVCSPGTL